MARVCDTTCVVRPTAYEDLRLVSVVSVVKTHSQSVSHNLDLPKTLVDQQVSTGVSHSEDYNLPCNYVEILYETI